MSKRQPFKSKPFKRSKYGNRIHFDANGDRYASGLELNRYVALELLQRAGEITELKKQVDFPLHVNGVKIGLYRADAVYREKGVLVVEDAKGLMTDIFKWKAKHFAAEYGFKIRLYKKGGHISEA